MANILKSQKLLSVKKYLTLFNLTPKYYYSKTTVIDHDPTIKVCLSILSSSYYYHSFLYCLHKKPTKCHLILKNGKTLAGYSFGYNKSKSGEIVFNTGMVG